MTCTCPAAVEAARVLKRAWQDSNHLKNPRLQRSFSGGGALSGAYAPSVRPVFAVDEPPIEPLEPDAEIDLAQRMARGLYRDAAEAEKRGRTPDRGGSAIPPDLSAYAPGSPRPSHLRTMTKAEHWTELVSAWPKLDAQETSAVLAALRQCRSVAERPHVSKLPPVDPDS